MSFSLVSSDPLSKSLRDSQDNSTVVLELLIPHLLIYVKGKEKVKRKGLGKVKDVRDLLKEVISKGIQKIKVMSAFLGA